MADYDSTDSRTRPLRLQEHPMTFLVDCPSAPRATSKMRATRGFTLIELMVVLVIIGVLAALIVPNVLGRLDQARVTAARSDINTLMGALNTYKLDNQRYPTAEQGLQALLAKPTGGAIPANWRGPYIPKLPNDPWDRPYLYANPGLKGEIDVYSFGADGVTGGEGNNADIGSWQ
jgi:general secretion pathway protein G